MGIFYNKENRHHSLNVNNDYNMLSAFPSHVIPAGNLEWNEYRALRNSDIFTAVTTIAKDIAKLDIKVRQNGITKEKDRLENLINNRPNPYYNGYMLKFIVMLNALLTRHGYILIERANGQPIELYHLKTSAVQLKEVDDGYYYEVNNGTETLEVPYTDIIDIKPYSSDGINGLSVLEALRDDLDAQNYSKKFFADFFRNGTQAGSVLKMKDGKLSPEARQKLKDEWQKANSAEGNAGKVLVLDETMEFSNLEIDTDILKMITSNTSSPTTIAKAFGLPLSKLGVEMTNTSMQDAMNDYLYNTLSSYMKVWTAELNFKLINSKDDYSKEFIFDTTSYRQVDWNAYITTLNTQLDKGAITLDEYREAIGKPKLPDGLGSKHRVDLNHINIEVADDYQLRQTSTNNQSTEAVSDDVKGGESVSE
ncbi:phage portal protein [Staphylococcus epidermidis]|nr:phage portal protein [Staphylococcus epidermidis]MCG2360237.1 phage portal protein [Staphylococcus epidermidis]MCG2367191.1 phage portal protein [Staphylococcus epidermidis]